MVVIAFGAGVVAASLLVAAATLQLLSLSSPPGPSRCVCGTAVLAVGSPAGFVGNQSTIGCSNGDECFAILIEQAGPAATMANTWFMLEWSNGTKLSSPPGAGVTLVDHNASLGLFHLATAHWTNYSAAAQQFVSGEHLVLDTAGLSLAVVLQLSFTIVNTVGLPPTNMTFQLGYSL